MDFVCMLVEVLKVKDHSVGAIFFCPHEYVGNNLIRAMPGGLNHTFQWEFLYLSIYYGRFSGGSSAVR